MPKISEERRIQYHMEKVERHFREVRSGGCRRDGRRILTPIGLLEWDGRQLRWRRHPRREDRLEEMDILEPVGFGEETTEKI